MSGICRLSFHSRFLSGHAALARLQRIMVEETADYALMGAYIDASDFCGIINWELRKAY